MPLISSMVTIILAILFLVFVSNIQVKTRITLWKAATLLFSTILFCTFLMKPIVQSFGFRDKTTGERIIKHNLIKLKNLSHTPKNIIIVEGGSYPARGLDGDLFANEIKLHGFDSSVLQFTIPGGNHFERFHILKRILNDLSSSEYSIFEKSHVILMQEVHLGYDKNPLAQFDSNKFSDRTYAYLTPDNTLAALQATIDDADIQWETLLYSGQVLSHTLVNAFNVGLLSRMALGKDLAPFHGFAPLNKPKKDFKFPGLEKIVLLLDRNEPYDTPSFNWLSRLREKRLKKLFNGYADEFIFFAVPSIAWKNIQYSKAFCESHNLSICIDVADPELFRSLDNQQYWYDYGHLTHRGSQIYTKWLAQQLISSGILIK